MMTGQDKHLPLHVQQEFVVRVCWDTQYGAEESMLELPTFTLESKSQSMKNRRECVHRVSEQAFACPQCAPNLPHWEEF
jgi:hypothetical protein